ncbi:hypothetical protein D3260_13595 [Salinisphaera sp. Q1T1-3]|nr:hypothetical protein D3260_13595 [Salinisphaera sp. Q1T1-3]
MAAALARNLAKPCKKADRVRGGMTASLDQLSSGLASASALRVWRAGLAAALWLRFAASLSACDVHVGR